MQDQFVDFRSVYFTSLHRRIYLLTGIIIDMLIFSYQVFTLIPLPRTGGVVKVTFVQLGEDKNGWSGGRYGGYAYI